MPLEGPAARGGGPYEGLRPHRPARPRARELAVEAGLVVEDVDGFVGAVVGIAKDAVTLEDRHGRRRLARLGPGFLVDGLPVVLVKPTPTAGAGRLLSRSGSTFVAGSVARTARKSRILVEGIHDAELVEKVWGHDLRVEGVVVEPLHGLDDLPDVVRSFAPGPQRRLGVLADHLVGGSKESRIAAAVASPHVLVTGHPYVDVWQAVRPRVLGLERWPVVPPGQPWKPGVCRALGWGEPGAAWQAILARVDSYADLEPSLLGAVERLIDFVTAQEGSAKRTAKHAENLS